jgi:TolB-like protein
MSEPSKAVFLSYASQDAEAARQIADTLRAAGIEVWFDQSELRGGDAWDQKIRRQIKDCALFIPIISAHSQARTEGYFRLEWHLADQRKLLMTKSRAFLLPVCIDGTAEANAEVPDSFSAVHWTRLPAGDTPPAFVERVARLLSPELPHAPAEVGAPAAAAPDSAAVPRQTTPGPAATRRLQAVLLAIAAIIIIGVGYFALDKFILSKRRMAAERTAPPTQTAAAAQRAIPEKSIAVLPFADLSEKKDQEYFADGMAAEVLDLLARIPGLKVIGRTSSFQFKDKSQDLRTIGSTLGAAYIVEGNVRKSGDHIRVTARLIDARDGTQRWSSTYDRKSSDVLEVQDAIAINLARALQLTVSSDFGARASAKSAEAYDVYLRGLHACDQDSQESIEQATGDFQHALDLDPTFARAALGLANAYRLQAENAWVLPTRVVFEHARQAADLAIRLDPTLGGAHAVRADILVMYDWDWVGAEREIKQALSLGDRVNATLAAARLAAVQGEWEQATHLLETGLAADPLNNDFNFLLAWGVDLRSGRFAAAESVMRRALEISPNAGSGHWFLGLALLFQNRLDEALAVMQQETPYDGQLEGTAVVYHAMGKNVESDTALKQAIEQNAEEWPSAIARAYAFRGERDQAMKWLERAYSVKDEDLYFIKGDPLMRNLESDPRYKAFLRKMNLPE